MRLACGCDVYMFLCVVSWQRSRPTIALEFRFEGLRFRFRLYVLVADFSCMCWCHQPLRSRPTIGTLACSIKCCSASSEPVGSPTDARSPPSEHRPCALVSRGTTVTVTPLLLTTCVGAMHPTSHAMQPFSIVLTLDRQQPARAASATKKQLQRQHLWGR